MYYHSMGFQSEYDYGVAHYGLGLLDAAGGKKMIYASAVYVYVALIQSNRPTHLVSRITDKLGWDGMY